MSLSIGVALARNTIANVVEAAITNADNTATATVGGITLAASETGAITATAAAASASAAIAGTAGISLSGAGAEATNVILTKVNAHVDASKLVSAGNVVLGASNTSGIHATVAAGSAAAGAAGAGGIGASIGASLARNLIGWNLDGSSAPPRCKPTF